ncbi:molecular chaperone MKKS-like isoform X2 [Tubulanus polymorphus]|uniref:molecular chaperone MKKS-like isoform X2 n=1 Tax=Tubulanus polymorphus TaxID=672921 RepID=UPI003DA51516
MSAMSPGGRVCMKQQSIVTYKHISDEDVLTSLCTLRQIVQSCYGPRSKLKIIHNQSLGHLTITSTSGRLLNCLSISKPYLKFVVTSVAGHLEKYKDGGLYTLLLTLSLIENGIKTGLKLPLVSELFAYFGHETLSLIEEVKIAGMENDLSLKAMLRLVNGIVRPKHACYVKQTNLDFLCKLLLESFLNSVPSQEDQNSSFNEVLKLGVEGLDVTESRLWTGVLLPFVHSVISDSCHFTKPLKVVVLVTSLSGDSNEFIHAKYELRNLQTTAVNDVVIQLWMEVCQQLVNDGVSVVFCQKVVHPILQQFLHENSVHVIDRLGSAAMKSVTHLTGCAPVISLKEQSLSECYGKLDGIDVVTVNKKKFYHLKNDRNSATKTLILCNWSEQALEELKYVSNVVQHVLQMSIFHPDILPGGGCFETLITTKLHNIFQ